MNASTTPVGRLVIAAVRATIRSAGSLLLGGSTVSVKVGADVGLLSSHLRSQRGWGHVNFRDSVLFIIR